MSAKLQKLAQEAYKCPSQDSYQMLARELSRSGFTDIDPYLVAGRGYGRTLKATTFRFFTSFDEVLDYAKRSDSKNIKRFLSFHTIYQLFSDKKPKVVSKSRLAKAIKRYQEKLE